MLGKLSFIDLVRHVKNNLSIIIVIFAIISREYYEKSEFQWCLFDFSKLTGYPRRDFKVFSGFILVVLVFIFGHFGRANENGNVFNNSSNNNNTIYLLRKRKVWIVIWNSENVNYSLYQKWRQWFLKCGYLLHFLF